MAKTPLAFDAHIQDWCNSSKLDKALYKGGNAYKVIMTILQVLLAFVPLILLVTYIPQITGTSASNVNAFMAKIRPIFNVLKIMLFVSSAIGIGAALWYVIDIISTYRFGGWMSRNNVNALPALMQCVDVKLGRSGKDRFRKTATAAGIGQKKSFVMLNTISSLLRMVAAIMIAVAVITYVANTLIDNMLRMLSNINSSTSPNDIKMVFTGYETFLVLVGVALAFSIIASIIYMVWKNQCFAWIRSEVSKAYNEQVKAEEVAAEQQAEEEKFNSSDIGVE